MKKLLSILIAIALMLSLSVTAFAAEEPTLYVAGVAVTSDNLEINSADNGAITGSATYDPDTKTLTLNNFSYTGEGYNYSSNVGALIYSTGIDLKIVLKGTNTFAGIDNYQEGIIIENGSLTIANSDADDVMGSLKLTAGYPVICVVHGSLFVENVNLTVINTLSPTGNPGEAILVTGDISITHSDVTAISGDSNGDDIPEEGATFGILTMGSISVTNSIVSATGYYGGMWANSLSVTNSIVTAAGNFGALFVGDSYPEECLVPTLNGEFTVTAGDDAASATDAAASDAATYENSYVRIEPAEPEAETKSTTITYQVDPTFTVTIPATVALGETATIKAENVVVAKGKQVEVALTNANGFTVATQQGEKLGYTVKNGETTVNEGDTVLTVNPDNGKTGETTLTFTTPETVKFAGDYTGTGTFTIAVKDVPKAMINFTIDGTSYQAEEGMTWAQWVLSDYNNGGFARDSYGGPVVWSGHNAVCCPGAANAWTDFIDSATEIKSGLAYTLLLLAG